MGGSGADNHSKFVYLEMPDFGLDVLLVKLRRLLRIHGHSTLYMLLNVNR